MCGAGREYGSQSGIGTIAASPATRTTGVWPRPATTSFSLAPPVASRAHARCDAPGDESRCPAAYREERAQFDYVFPKATELTGHMKLRLWVETIGADDMDLFVRVQKFDRA